MPLLPGYKHAHSFNIPKTTKGPDVEKCLAERYPFWRGIFPGEDPKNKRIAAAKSHMECDKLARR